MTVKRRLALSNILMILVPVISTALIGALCVAILCFILFGGVDLDLDDREDFDYACMAMAEVAEIDIQAGRDLSSLEGMLGANGMTMKVTREGQDFYSFGESGPEIDGLINAAGNLEQDGFIRQGGRGLYYFTKSVEGQEYRIYITGGNFTEDSYSGIKAVIVISAVLIVITIILSIFLTNRFLTRFVFRKIETPLDILTNGVHEIRDGNLDYRIEYNGRDEFKPVCEDFNEMARRLQDSIERIQRQETSRKELIAGISHDIRSPLTSIKAYVEGLMDGVAKTPQVQQKYLETIKTKTEELNHIVSQLFLFSKMELGDYPDRPCVLRLDETVLKTVSTLKDEYSQKGLAIETDMEPVSVYADPLQIERITTNILENSLKYKVKEHGKVKISLHRSEKGVCLSFADDGPGVPPESLPHLFEVFYRGDPAREHPDQGSGLGLAIVASAVQRMGGTAEAAKSDEGGLEIRIEIPERGDEDGENPDN